MASVTETGSDLRRQVVALIREGKSYGQVATALGLTRSAVGGHVSRAREAGEKIEPPTKNRGGAKPSPKASAKPAEPARTPAVKPAVTPVAPEPPASQPKPALVAPSPPEAEPVRGAAQAVAALRNAQCHWPVGDPHDEDFRFCCAPVPTVGPVSMVKRFYCAEHRGVACADRGGSRPLVPRRSSAPAEAAHG